MEVELPNGVVIEGVPEGATKEQIKAKAIAAGLAKESDFPQVQAVTPTQQAQAAAPAQQAEEAHEPINIPLGLSPLSSAQVDVSAFGKGVKQGIANIGLGALEASNEMNPVFKIAKMYGVEAIDQLEKGIADFRNSLRSETEQAAKVSPKSTMAGEIAGEVAALPIPVAQGGKALATTAKMAGLGAVEGGLSAKGRGEDPLEGALIGAGFAGGLGVLSEGAQRLLRARLAQKGSLNADDIQQAAARAQAGDDVTLDGAKDLDAAARRMKAFEEEGVTPTRGDITKEFDQQKLESQLFISADEPGARMRDTRLQQSEAIRSRLDEMISSAGVSDDVGESLKEALKSRKKYLKEEVSTLYKRLGEQAESLDVPLVTSKVSEALPDERLTRRFTNTNPGQMKNLDETLSYYGVKPGGEDINPLSIKNYESMRQELNEIVKADPSMAVVVNPIKKALDDTMDDAMEAIIKSGNPNISETAKEARRAFIALKTEFDDKAMTDILIQPKARWSSTPKVEQSQVYQKLMANSTPVEQFDNVITSLKKEGAQGSKALNDMKAKMMLDIVDSAFSASSRQIDGVPVFGAAAYQKALENMRPKLEKVLSKQELKRLENLDTIAKAVQPPSGAVPVGSAGFFVDVLNRLGLPTLAAKDPTGVAPMAMELLRTIGKKGQNSAAIEKALQQPKIKERLKFISENYPTLYASLGVKITEDDE